MRSIDLFSGAGGLTRGLQRASVETVAAVELDAFACSTYRRNFPSVALMRADVRTLDFRKWRGRVDLVVGGPPCQPFSVAGLQLAHRDPRDCVPMFTRAVAEVQPDAFIMENVAGLTTLRHRPYLLHAIDCLARLGYIVTYKILNAADYGIPQFRMRLFVVGLRDHVFVFPPPTHGKRPGLCPYVTAGHALVDVPDDIPNTAIVTYAKMPVMRPQPWDGMLVNGGGRPINLAEPSQTIPASAGGNRTHIVDPKGVLSAYHAHLREGGRPREGIVEGVRRLTVTESARLQAFPDDHVFVGPQSARYRQVGNAIPPLLAEAVARAVVAQVRGERGCESAERSIRQLALFAD